MDGMVYKELLRKVFQHTLGMDKSKVTKNAGETVGSLPKIVLIGVLLIV